MHPREILAHLKNFETSLRQYGVKRLVMFGPAARGEHHIGNPIDFLVEFFPPVTYQRYLALRDYLQELLGSPVEPVIESIHHQEVWPLVKDEAVIILE